MDIQIEEKLPERIKKLSAQIDSKYDTVSSVCEIKELGMIKCVFDDITRLNTITSRKNFNETVNMLKTFEDATVREINTLVEGGLDIIYDSYKTNNLTIKLYISSSIEINKIVHEKIIDTIGGLIWYARFILSYYNCTDPCMYTI